MDSSRPASDDAIEKLLRRVSATPPVLTLRRPIRTGDRLASGRFDVLEELGKGGMGRVFAAYDHESATHVALKVIGRITPQAIVQLKREFRTASELVHSHIVRLHELFRDGMEWFFTMELVRGVLLPDLLARTEALSQPALIRLVAQQLATALRAVHEFGAIHGDLKPSNFLIETEGPLRAVLLDFGLAQTFGDPAAGGTAAYMAPEQLFGESVTELTDWYSLGVVIHEALSGKLPQDGVLNPALADAPVDLHALCKTLLEPLPQNRPSGIAVLTMLGVPLLGDPSSSSVPPRSRLVGRRREIAQFQALRASVSPSAPSMVLVNGPSGIGKTALIEHLVQIERTRGAIVLRGRCRENESIGYKAIDGIVDDLVSVLSEMSAAEAKQVLPKSVVDLVQLFPALRASSAIAEIAIDDVERGDQALVRQRAITAFAELLRKLGAFGPLVLWIDDLQWSDSESALILGPVLSGVEPVPVLFIGSYRTDRAEPVPILHALSADRSLTLPRASELTLGLLDEADAEQMARELLRDDISDASGKAREIARDAAGLPLFITELAHMTRSAPARSPDSAPVTLSSVVNQRVIGLSSSARHLLELVAIAGNPVSRAVLKQAQRLRPTELDDAISVLRANRLILTTGLREEHTVDIRHDRLRELVSRGIDDDRRKQHHLSLAAILEARGGKSEEIATHYQGAGELPRAARYWLAAADDSAKALAFQKAADFYDRALKRAPLEAAERHRVQLRRAEMLAYAGEGELAAQVFLAAAHGCPRDEAIELRRRAAEQLLLSGRIQEGLHVIDEVLAVTRMPRTRGGKSAIPSLLVGRLRVRLRGLRYRLRTEAELSREELARLDVAWTMACSMGFVDYIRGADFQNRHLLLALRAGEPRRLGRALALEALNAAAPAPGSRRRTDLLLKISESLVDRSPDRDSALGLLSLARGVAAYLHSDTEAAVTHCSEAVETLTARCAGAVWERVTAQRFLIASLFHSGQFRRLSEAVPPLLAEAEVTANLYSRQFCRSGYSIVSWLIRDEIAEARRHLALAADEWCSASYQLPEYNRLLSQTYIDLYAGEWERSAETIRQHWSRVEDAQLLRIAIVRVQMWQLRGATAVAAEVDARNRGDIGAAARFRTDARKCVAMLRRDRLRRAQPMAALIDAAIDAAEGARAESEAKLEGAADSFEHQGMQLFAAAARLRLGTLRGDAARPAVAEQARERFLAQNVARPERMTAMLAPGFAAPVD